MHYTGDKIKEHIDKSGISQSELAKKLGISRQHLHDILKENRKSKYLRDIVKLLNIPKFDDPFLEEKTITDSKKLPLLSLEDLLHLIDGSYSTNHIYKPFYKEWPFYEPEGTQSHFCIRLPQEFSASPHAYAIGAFRFYNLLQPQEKTILIVYNEPFQKILTGYLQVNTQTDDQFLVSTNRIDRLGKDTKIVAECTQLINLFEQDA